MPQRWMKKEIFHNFSRAMKPMQKWNDLATGEKKFVHPRNRIRFWNIVPGDRVQVIKGEAEDIGKEGEVMKIFKQYNTIMVDGVNLVCLKSLKIVTGLTLGIRKL